MIILTQDRRRLVSMGDYDSITMGDGNSGKVYFKHDNVNFLIGEYQSGYQAQAVIMDIYNTFGISPKYCMPTVGEAKRLMPSVL